MAKLDRAEARRIRRIALVVMGGSLVAGVGGLWFPSLGGVGLVTLAAVAFLVSLVKFIAPQLKISDLLAALP